MARRPRTGGRSARIAAAVMDAVEELSKSTDRSELTVPLIALKAGVPPSTIYRRWGSISELMSDIAVDRMRPASEPADTGALATDLEGWIELYIEETASQLGRTALRDLFGSVTDMSNPVQCSGYTYGQLQLIATRAAARSEAVSADDLVDLLVAPVIYRILFGGKPLDKEYGLELVKNALLVVTKASPDPAVAATRGSGAQRKAIL